MLINFLFSLGLLVFKGLKNWERKNYKVNYLSRNKINLGYPY